MPNPLQHWRRAKRPAPRIEPSLADVMAALVEIKTTVATLRDTVLSNQKEMLMAAKAIDKGVADMVVALTAAEALEDRANLFVQHTMDRLAQLITPRTDPDTTAEINKLLTDYQTHASALATTLTTGEPDVQPGVGLDGVTALNGTNGSDQQNADFARGVAAGQSFIAGTLLDTVPNIDKLNPAFVAGWATIVPDQDPQADAPPATPPVDTPPPSTPVANPGTPTDGSGDALGSNAGSTNPQVDASSPATVPGGATSTGAPPVDGGTLDASAPVGATLAPSDPSAPASTDPLAGQSAT